MNALLHNASFSLHLVKFCLLNVLVRKWKNNAVLSEDVQSK